MMPAMTFSERNLTEGEQIITKFRPHWRLLFVPIGWILLGLVALWLVYAVIPWENTTFQLVMTGLILLALIPLTIAPLITWWFTTYILTNAAAGHPQRDDRQAGCRDPVGEHQQRAVPPGPDRADPEVGGPARRVGRRDRSEPIP